MPFVLLAQNDMDDIIIALKNGDAQQLAAFFDNKVELSVPGKTSTYNKSQAESVINDFFNNNKIQSFEEKHKGKNNGMEYCIGNAVTSNGIYKTTFFTKLKSNKQLIQTLRFESN